MGGGKFSKGMYKVAYGESYAGSKSALPPKIALSFNGRTSSFEGDYRGSSPCGAAKKELRHRWGNLYRSRTKYYSIVVKIPGSSSPTKIFPQNTVLFPIFFMFLAYIQ